jgi:toxin HigB-1
MIKIFADKYTQQLYLTGKSRRFPPQILRRAIRKLEQVNAATSLEDLKVPPSNRLHALEKERKRQHSLSIVSERKREFFVKVKENQNFNRRHTLSIPRIKILS